MPKTSNPRAFVNPSPTTPGHVVMRDERNELLGTESGPRAFMISVYRGMGYTVIENN